MGKLRSHNFFKRLVVVFLFAYLFGYFSNMFYIPRYTYLTPKTNGASVVAFNRVKKLTNFHTANFLQIIDRSTLDNDRINALTLFPKCLLLIFMGLGFLKLHSVLTQAQSAIFYNRRYAYLSLCSIRI